MLLLQSFWNPMAMEQRTVITILVINRLCIIFRYLLIFLSLFLQHARNVLPRLGLGISTAYYYLPDSLLGDANHCLKPGKGVKMNGINTGKHMQFLEPTVHVNYIISPSSLVYYLGTNIISPASCTTRRGAGAFPALGYCAGEAVVTSRGRFPRLSLRKSSAPGGKRSHSLWPQIFADQL